MLYTNSKYKKIKNHCTNDLLVTNSTILGTLTGKGPLGRPRPSWEDNIRMDLKEIAINTRKWVDAAKDRDYWRALVNVALNLQVP